MFDLPARFSQDEKYFAVKVKTRAHFRKAEKQELQTSRHDNDNRLRFSELRDEMPLDPLDRGFVGFVSQGIYDDTGVLKGDIATTSMATLGRNQQPRKYKEPQFDLSANEWGTNTWGIKNSQGISASQQHTVILLSGLETLPRSTAPPKVRKECSKTRQIIEQSSQRLSKKAQNILQRTNFSHDRNLSYNLRDDIWTTGIKMYRRRGMKVVATILWTSLDRGDYERAYKALAVLIRSDGIIMRNLWMPAVELLAWKQSQKDSYHTSHSPTAFLDWLIVNFPMATNNAALWRKIPRAEKFRPLAIISRLVGGDYRGAMEKAEEAILTIPSSVDPLCWALAGLIALKVQDATGEVKTQDAQKYFRRCLELGGVLPRKYNGNIERKPKFTEGELESESESDAESGSASVFMSESQPEFNSEAETELETDSSSNSRTMRARVSSSKSNNDSISISGSESETDINSEDVKLEEWRPRKRTKRDSDDVMDETPDRLLIKQEPKSQVSQGMKVGGSSQSQNQSQSQQSTFGAAWSDEDSEEEDEDEEEEEEEEEEDDDDDEVGERQSEMDPKPEILTQPVQPFTQSQGSTLGAAWTDSDSEDY